MLSKSRKINVNSSGLRRKTLQPVWKRSKSTQSEISMQEKCPIGNNVKPFDSIPGPKPVFFFGNFFEIVKKGGVPKFFEIISEWHQKYGDIIKFSVGRTSQISVSDPALIEQVFRENGPMPVRTEFPYTIQYCKERNLPPTLVDANGEEWARQRKCANKPFLQPSKTDLYIPQLEQVGRDLVDLIRIRTKESSGNILPNLSSVSQRFAFEAICAVMFGKGLGVLQEPIPPKAKEFIEESLKVTSTVGQTTAGFPWHLFLPWSWNANYRKLSSQLDKLIGYGNDFIDETQSTSSENSLLCQMEKTTLDEKTKKMMLPSTLVAGVDTTQLGFQWLLYNLSTSPEVQEKLYQEIITHVPEGTPVSAEVFHKMSYLKNCLQESLRRTTVTPLNARNLDHDIILGGYFIPKRTQINLANLSTTRDPRLWGDPEAFRPERFAQEKVHPFAHLTFGQGQRSCIGQRIALAELSAGIVHVLRSFKLEYKGAKPPGARLDLFLGPDIPLEVAFIPRK